MLEVPFIIVKTAGMLMDNVRCNGIEERAIMGSTNGINENEEKNYPAPTRQRVFQAMSGDNPLAMLTRSGRLDAYQRKAYYSSRS